MHIKKVLIFLIALIFFSTLGFLYTYREETYLVVYNKIHDDPSIDAKIISAKKENDNLIVIFSHDLPYPQQILIEDDVKYNLSKEYPEGEEEVVLTVFGWRGERFKLFVGLSPDVFEFD